MIAEPSTVVPVAVIKTAADSEVFNCTIFPLGKMCAQIRGGNKILNHNHRVKRFKMWQIAVYIACFS